MTVFDIADATTPFFDACMFFLLFEAFLVLSARYSNLDVRDCCEQSFSDVSAG